MEYRDQHLRKIIGRVIEMKTIPTIIASEPRDWTGKPAHN
jgi:hypothetical protein